VDKRETNRHGFVSSWDGFLPRIESNRIDELTPQKHHRELLSPNKSTPSSTTSLLQTCQPASQTGSRAR